MNDPNRDFFAAYVVCALWSSTDDNDAPMDSNYSASDIAEETEAKMRVDCERFQAENRELLGQYYEQLPLGRDSSGEFWTPEAQAGHDFWLSRNGHGAGFFDRDVDRELRDRLQEKARGFGQFDLYVGDDAQVWGQ